MCVILATRIAQWYNPIDMFLSSVLKSKYIHSELIFPAWTSYKDHSFSSRGRIKDSSVKIKGVQFSTINYNKSRWLFTDLNKITTGEIIALKRKCLKFVGKKYDGAGAVFNAGFKLPVDKRDKFWCSEIIAHVLMEYYDSISTDNLTPQELLWSVRTCNFWKDINDSK